MYSTYYDLRYIMYHVIQYVFMEKAHPSAKVFVDVKLCGKSFNIKYDEENLLCAAPTSEEASMLVKRLSEKTFEAFRSESTSQSSEVRSHSQIPGICGHVDIRDETDVAVWCDALIILSSSQTWCSLRHRTNHAVWCSL
jgi:hypothetical protein